MKIRVQKTKATVIARNSQALKLNIEGTKIQKVNKYTNLSRAITQDVRCKIETRRRIATAKREFKNKHIN